MVVADFGSGSGHYVLATAKKMSNSGLPAGQAGVVYAIDIQKNLLEAVKSEAERQHLSNVDIIWADIEGKEGTKLASGTLDLAIASNILFQINDKDALAREILEPLKTVGGRRSLIGRLLLEERGRSPNRWRPKRSGKNFHPGRIFGRKRISGGGQPLRDNF